MATVLYPGIAFSPQATLTNNIGAADSIIEVSDVSAFPPAPNLATIGTDEEARPSSIRPKRRPPSPAVNAASKEPPRHGRRAN